MSSSGFIGKPNRITRTVVPGNRTIDEVYEEEAHQIVDEAIENARRRLSEYTCQNEEVPDLREEPTVDPETGYVVPNIAWMTADNFTVAGGLEKIEEFIKVWKLRFYVIQITYQFSGQNTNFKQ